MKESSSISTNDIFNRHYKNRCYERRDNIDAFADIFIHEIVDPRDNHLYSLQINTFAISELTLAAFVDTIRYKEYHLTPKNNYGVDMTTPNTRDWHDALHLEPDSNSSSKNHSLIKPSKVAAFTAKWILKYKPINVIAKDEYSLINMNSEQVKRSTSFNEKFALLYCLKAIMNIDHGISHDILSTILYHFKYRQFDDRHFQIIFELLSNKDFAQCRVALSA